MSARRDARLLAIDQGTTGTTVLLLDSAGRVVARGYAELPQHFPRPGLVEHRGEEIWQTVLHAVGVALGRDPAPGSPIAAIGITNQRETTLLWERSTSRPVAPAIVWQDRRTVGPMRGAAAGGPRARDRAADGPSPRSVFLGDETGMAPRSRPGRPGQGEAG